MDEIKIREFAKENFIPIVREKTSKLLIEKIKEINPKTILEIGTAIGYSGTIMLENSNAHLTTLEKDENMKNLALQNFKNENLLERVDLIFGDALDFITVSPKKFDFIFLDGPKGQYAKYLPNLINMLNDNGLIFCDNVLFNGLVQNKDAIIPKKHRTIVKNLRKFLSLVQENDKLINELINLEDGICLIRKSKKIN